MWRGFRRPDNEWLAADRRERRKTMLIALGFFAAVAAGLVLLVHALVSG